MSTTTVNTAMDVLEHLKKNFDSNSSHEQLVDDFNVLIDMMKTVMTKLNDDKDVWEKLKLVAKDN